MPSLDFHLDLSALESQIDGIEDKTKAAVRPAAQAGAQVLYNRVLQNVAGIGVKSGNLRSSIYQAYSKDNSGEKRATYHISWNTKKAPHGHLLEFGHVQRYAVFLGSDGQWHTDKKRPIAPRIVAARPFVRPARDSIPAALEAVKDRFAEEMKK